MAGLILFTIAAAWMWLERPGAGAPGDEAEAPEILDLAGA
jgi:hypothetical protein